jgi:hypothetical protein
MPSEEPPETVADLDADRTVWHTSRGNGDQPSVHLEEDCRFIRDLDARDDDAGDLRQDRDVCRECSGAAKDGGTPGRDPTATRQQLLALEPDEAGLSPLGERGETT